MMATRTINVIPSDNLFNQLGNNSYTYLDVLSELIDNSIAARVESTLLKVSIKVIVNKRKEPIEFLFKDNASGITDEELPIAISPAAKQSSNSLNEHGMGMKQAIASIGVFNSITTQSKYDCCPKKIREFKFGKITVVDTDEISFENGTGTLISVTDLKNIVDINTSNLTRSLIVYLGARYRKFLKPEAQKMDLRIFLQYSGEQNPYYEQIIKEEKPVYFHPLLRQNKPLIQSYRIKKGNYEALLTFGFSPTHDGEYTELGIDKPNCWHPYRVARATQGLDVLLHGRVIMFHQLHELGFVQGEHSDYNNVRGEIELIEGFSTAITKNQLIKDENFKECMDEISMILNGEIAGPKTQKTNYLKRNLNPKHLPEAILQKRLVEFLSDNKLLKFNRVIPEYVFEEANARVDIMVDEMPLELKADEAAGKDVYQLLMYMDCCDSKVGLLVAKSFSHSAKYTVELIQNKYSKEIRLSKLEEYPILEPLSAEEVGFSF